MYFNLHKTSCHTWKKQKRSRHTGWSLARFLAALKFAQFFTFFTLIVKTCVVLWFTLFTSGERAQEVFYTKKFSSSCATLQRRKPVSWSSSRFFVTFILKSFWSHFLLVLPLFPSTLHTNQTSFHLYCPPLSSTHVTRVCSHWVNAVFYISIFSLFWFYFRIFIPYISS